MTLRDDALLLAGFILAARDCPPKAIEAAIATADLRAAGRRPEADSGILPDGHDIVRG